MWESKIDRRQGSAEEPVGPAKPRACEGVGMVLVEGLDHPAVRRHGELFQGIQAGAHLVFVRGGLDLDKETDGPDHRIARMRAADAAPKRTGKIPRVGRRQHKAPGALVQSVILSDEPQERERQQRRRVGIVHQQVAAITVDLVRKDLAIGGVVDDGMGVDCLMDGVSEKLCLGRYIMQCCVVAVGNEGGADMLRQLFELR